MTLFRIQEAAGGTLYFTHMLKLTFQLRVGNMSLLVS